MPLIKGKSRKSFEKNVKSEMEAGKPQDQALAIAYSMKRQAGKKHMAEGGEVEMSPKSIVDAIRRKKSEQADLQENANEDLNLEDQLSFEAARKDTYYDLDQVEEQPEDSNEHGHDMEDDHDMDLVSKIRRKAKKM